MGKINIGNPLAGGVRGDEHLGSRFFYVRFDDGLDWIGSLREKEFRFLLYLGSCLGVGEIQMTLNIRDAMEHLGVGERSVRGYLQELERMGYIKRYKSRRSSVVFINPRYVSRCSSRDLAGLAHKYDGFTG